MAATPWTVYYRAKGHLCDGVIDLDPSSLRMALFTSASNASDLTLSSLASVTTPISGADVVVMASWVSAGPNGMTKLQLDAPVTFSGPLEGVKFGALYDAPSGKLVCVSEFAEAAFNIVDGDTLNIGSGFFHLL